MPQFPASIPFELMEILNQINSNINEVKERLAKIEGQDHAETFKAVRDEIKDVKAELKEEQKLRNNLEIDIERLKTKLAPVLVVASLIGAGVVQAVFSSLIH